MQYINIFTYEHTFQNHRKSEEHLTKPFACVIIYIIMSKCLILSACSGETAIKQFKQNQNEIEKEAL